MKKLFLIFFILYTILITAQTQIGSSIHPNLSDERSGHSISLSSDGMTVAVGSMPTNINSSNARVHSFDGQNWIQKGQTIVINNTNGFSSSSYCRVSLSADGNTLAVSNSYLGPSSNGGITQVFQYDGTLWQQLGQDLNGNSSDLSGSSISLSSNGNILAILSQKSYYNNIDFGDVTIYQFNGTVWQQLGQKITGYLINQFDPNYESYTMLQGQISLSDDGFKIAIATPESNSGSNPKPGTFQSYQYNGSMWVQYGQTLSGATNDTNYSWDTDLTGDGNTVVIGSNGYNYQEGYFQVFELQGNLWTQKGSTIFSPDIQDNFGHSVSISDNGELVVVGSSASYNSNSSSFAGNVKVFKYNNNDWSQIGNTIFGTASNHQLGRDTAITPSGNVMGVGVPNRTIYPYSHSGAVNIYDLANILSVDEHDLKKDVYIFPNPSSQYITIASNHVLDEVEIYSSLGQKILHNQIGENKTTLDISQINTGLYFIVTSSNGIKYTNKIIKD